MGKVKGKLMEKHHLWSKELEKQFFIDTLKITSVDDLFYKSEDGTYYAYWPKGYSGKKSTLQSRNSYVGKFTESYVEELLSDFAKDMGYFSVRDVVCQEIGLPKKSPADVAICKTNSKIQEPQNVVAIFEVKMSIVWNWKYDNGEIVCIGDYSTHQGTPSLLRSDSMLKAIGKAINIRISNKKAHNIPIFILGNTPITPHYYEKVDNLKSSGIIQGFWSLNPKPLDNFVNPIESTDNFGFQTIQSYKILLDLLTKIIGNKLQFFSSMMSKNELGRIIKHASQEGEEIKIAEKFLTLLWRNNEKEK